MAITNNGVMVCVLNEAKRTTLTVRFIIPSYRAVYSEYNAMFKTHSSICTKVTEV